MGSILAVFPKCFRNANGGILTDNTACVEREKMVLAITDAKQYAVSVREIGGDDVFGVAGSKADAPWGKARDG